MAYTPFGWQDDPSTATPLDSATLEDFGAHVAEQVIDETIVTFPGDPDPLASTYPEGALWIKVL